jgi:lipoprotein Spr
MKTHFLPALILSCFLLPLWTSCGSRHKLSTEQNSISTATELKIRQKYAALLGVPEKDLDNLPLYEFIDKWTGTPYLYGGKTKNGIDCSGFTEKLFLEVYHKELIGSSADLFKLCRMESMEKLREGDLVFFKIESDKISHVGVYLANGKFVHATVHRGVMIDDLKEAYYTKYYYKGGRIE